MGWPQALEEKERNINNKNSINFVARRFDMTGLPHNKTEIYRLTNPRELGNATPGLHLFQPPRFSGAEAPNRDKNNDGG